MAKIKLLHITSSLKIGGAEQVLYTLISQLDSRTFDHQVIYFHAGPYVERLQALGIPTCHIKGLLFRYDPLFFIRLYKAIKRMNPDCIHTLLWVANFAGRICAWLQNIPSISVFHNNVDQDGALRNFLDRYTISFAHTLVAVSNPVKESAFRFLGSCKPIAVVPNGIMRTQSPNAQTRESIGLDANHFVVGAVGRFEPVKRYDVLLHCIQPLMSNYPHVRLCLMGVGSQENKLRALAAHLGISHAVIFLVGKQAADYYRLFDCFVQTTEKEGVSLALLEAMSAAVPCLVMHDTAHHPVIHHGENGLVVDAKKNKLFERTLEQLMLDPGLRARLGAAAKEHVERHFTAEVMVSVYKKLFCDAVR